MNEPGVGIKIADGSFYPVIEQGFIGRKRFVLTTISDNQTRLQLDFYTSTEAGNDSNQYVGSVIVDDIPAVPQGEAEIEVIVSRDSNDTFTADAGGAESGAIQSLNVNLQTLTQDDTYGLPDSVFEIEDEEIDIEDSEEEAFLTGETYPIGAADSRKKHLHKKKRSPLALAGFILLGLVVISVVAFLIFKIFRGPEVPPLLAGVLKGGLFFSKEQSTAPSENLINDEAAQEEVVPASETPAEIVTAAGDSGEEEVQGVWYRIKKGDTLWDISATFYRNPWLYYKIARTNEIEDPDQIFAGTKIFVPDD